MQSEGTEREAALGPALNATAGLASATVRREVLTAVCLSI